MFAQIDLVLQVNPVARLLESRVLAKTKGPRLRTRYRVVVINRRQVGPQHGHAAFAVDRFHAHQRLMLQAGGGKTHQGFVLAAQGILLFVEIGGTPGNGAAIGLERALRNVEHVLGGVIPACHLAQGQPVVRIVLDLEPGCLLGAAGMGPWLIEEHPVTAVDTPVDHLQATVIGAVGLGVLNAHFNPGGVRRRPEQRWRYMTAVGVAVVLAEAALGLVSHGQAAGQAEILTQRPADPGLATLIIVGAGLKLDLSFGNERRTTGDDVDQAARVAPPVQHGCRPLEHLDPLDVHQIRQDFRPYHQ
ncbi:hypothetical protein D3C73_935960 [compost metagenome]